jgi:hypothetical protein
MADKLAKAAAVAAKRGAQRIYFPNRVIQFMSNQEKEEELNVVKFRVSPKMNKLEVRLLSVCTVSASSRPAHSRSVLLPAVATDEGVD